MARKDPATEREQLEQAFAHLENQRSILGDAVVDAALASLQEKLDRLKQQAPISAAAGERRVVTVLFCDVAGSTSLAEGMDPEAWTDIMSTAFEYLVAPVKQYGGTVANLMGDAILAVFGAPIAHEDDPQRAILAGLAIVENIKPFREKLQSKKGIIFNVRVGINTGLAVVGNVGSKETAEFTAMGDVVNIAARMEQTAQPGTVQITRDTYTLVAPLFEVEALGGISVKGKSKPVPAYKVLASKVKPGHLRGLAGHGISSPLIGRENELKTARDAINRLLKGEGGFLSILGEAGLGKSRLVAEIRRSLTQPMQDDARNASQTTTDHSALTWLEGHTLSYGKNISYWLFQDILRSYAVITEEDDEYGAWRKLEASVHELFSAETTEILPYLGSLLALEVTDEYSGRVKFLDSEELRRQVYRASRLFFQRLAERAPLVLVLDDLHWMDTSSSGLLEHLLPLIQRVPVLICGLSRPDAGTPAMRMRKIAAEQYREHYTQLDLLPLSASDSDHLVHNLLDIDDIPAHIRRMMVSKADGNPFFLEEIVRNLIEAGALVHEPSTGRWRATPAAEHVTVPDTIQGLIMARIDRLDEDLKRVVRRAAVIGRTFLYRILNAILEEGYDLKGKLDHLQQVELIQEKQRIPELEYIFKHSLAQEAAYNNILLQERRELHARVGAAIETLMADRLEEFYGLLAYHYSEAEQWDRAQEYLFKAGDQAGRMAADAEALAHYRQAKEAYARVRGDEWEPIERARLERKIGEALYRLGKHQQARPYLERSLALLGEGLPSSRWGMRLAIALAILTQIAHRLLPRLFVQPMQGSLDSAAEEIYLTSMALGGVEFLSNTERYLLLAVRALNTSERRGYAYGSATLAANMGVAATMIGSVRMAEGYYRQSAAYRQQIDPYRPVPQLEIGLSGHYNVLADFEKMREYALKGMEIAQSAGNLRVWGIGKINLVWAYWGQGQYDVAAKACEELLQTAEDSSDRQLSAWALLALGCIQQRCGLASEAIASHQRAAEIAKDLPDWATYTGSGGWMGRSYLALGKVEEAIKVMETTQERFLAKAGNLLGYVFLGNGLADAYLTVAEASDGDVRQAWLQKTRIVCQRTLKGAKHIRMALPEALMFRGRYEWLKGKPAAAQKWWSRALTQAEATGMPYEEGMIHLEIGRCLGDRQHIESAISILESIGAVYDLGKAKQALQNLSGS